MSFDSLRSVAYFSKTLWLFTLSDIKTFVFPQTLFGLFGALSSSLLTTSPYPSPNFIQIILRIPKVVLWTWLNTLVFTLANQRLPKSIKEDISNKPHRPLASDRINAVQARRLLFVSLPIILGITYFYLGSYEETVLLYTLNWMYNDLGGSDEHFVTRNLIISIAFTLYDCGALRVAISGHTQDSITISPTGYTWACIVGAIIFTTVQVQDLGDQEGDRSRSRKTAPLVLGDDYTRWTVAIPVIIWSLFCPYFWRISLYTSLPLMALGLVLVARVVFLRGFSADRQTESLWAYWLAILYILPVFKSLEVRA